MVKWLMVIKRKTRNLSPNTPLGICLLVGASSAVLSAVVVTVSTVAVRADARIPVSAATVRPAPPILSATPASLAPPSPAPNKTDAEPWTDSLRGIASWYGSVLNGHRTASGERFDMYAMTACHNKLPFGTMVRVVNLKNKKSVVVRINDRGVLSDGRIIDLSYAAAQELKITKAGLAPVALEVISLGRPRHRK